MLYLIEILHQTTTIADITSVDVRLYLIEILHQTTTSVFVIHKHKQLYLIEILHQTTTPIAAATGSPVLYLIEILHQTTTQSTASTKEGGLYLIEILHQTTTSSFVVPHTLCCILSKFYIKPQRSAKRFNGRSVVSYRNSTSNHNAASTLLTYFTLYLIEILHQTTTKYAFYPRNTMLYLIEILHQTTTWLIIWGSPLGCILSKFYIKPQLYGVTD